MPKPSFSKITAWLYQNVTPHRMFSEIRFFGTSISQNSTGAIAYKESICLVSQITIAVVELCKSNCQNLLGDTRKILVKSQKGLKGTEVFAQRFFRKKMVWKVPQNWTETILMTFESFFRIAVLRRTCEQSLLK